MLPRFPFEKNPNLDARTEAKRLTSIYAGAISGGPNQINKNIATTLAFGILADAILIRTILVPSLISLTGHANWWMPKWKKARTCK